MGENLSTKYLIKKGYKIVDRNFRCKSGEIDIIAENKDYLIFIEVKTRSSLCYGKPQDAVHKYKRKNMIKTARYYLYINKFENRFIRFDIIEIYLKRESFKINHIQKVDIFA